MFTDCLNAILTKTSIDNKLIFVKKNPLNIMLKKHEQCVDYRIFNNIDCVVDFIYLLSKKFPMDKEKNIYSLIRDLYRLIVENKTILKIIINNYTLYIKQYY